jgi:opacity protein-like surface antigen
MKNNEKMTIDEQVRAALENFAQPYNAENWQKMTERLDALDAADTSFDKSLRGRLADISILPMADAWSKMADKLDDMDAADSSFDDALRGRLADVVAAPSMGDWSKMSAVLDNFDDAETDFDEVLRRKLENIAGKHPNHWAMMNERLDREFTLKGKIVRYKIVEAALMLFAFFTVLNVLDFNTEEPVPPSRESFSSELKIRNEEIKTQQTQTSELNTKPEELKTAKQSTTTTPQFNVLPNTTKDAKSFDNTPNWRLRGGIQSGQNTNQNKQNSLQNAQPNQQPNWAPTGQPIVESLVQKAFYTEGSLSGNNSVQNVASSTNQLADATVNNVDKSGKTTQSIVEVIAPIDILKANLLENNGLDAPINLIKPAADKKGKWRLSTFGTTALDWVTTSFVDKNRDQHFQKQTVANVGVNALVAYKHGKVELETGLMVNRKKYSIENVEVVNVAVVRGTKSVEKPKDLRLSIVSIPLNLNMRLKETRRLNVYAHAGVAANAIVDALDRREDTPKQSLDPNYSGPSIQVDDHILASYSKGLINGGETKDNLFFTGHVGVGVEYKLTTKTSLFLQPTASFMLDKKRGIGSLDDRIKTYSIQGGAKWRL